ncbi:glutamate receptor 2 [Octopus sinensis]|uniref:Glutamate receptor 2 n=1 Tax=Octopus sinensis TaxID=2607531 RepID=A0A6P7SHZ6_9MOLL|nr:glutamate receptor 2 [Octopus sinensis]
MSMSLKKFMFSINLASLGFFLLISFQCIVTLAEAKNPAKKVIKVSTFQIHPFYMEEKHESGTEQHGYIVDMLAEMAPLMNVTFEINLVKDGHFGQIREDGNWTGMIGEVISGHADIAAAPLTLTLDRLKHVDMSFPFLSSGYKIVIKKPEAIQMTRGLFIVLKPFTTPVWCFIILAYVLTGSFLAIIGRISPYEWTNASDVDVDSEKRSSFNCMNSFWFTFSTFMWQGYRIAPRSYSGRTLSVFWWIFVLVTLVLYIGSMAAHLLANRPKNEFLPFTTFHELAKQSEVRYGAVKSGSTVRYFKRSSVPVERVIYENIMKDQSVLTSSVREGLQRVRESEGKYAYIMEGDLAEFLVSQKPCDLMVVGDIGDHSYSFVTQKNSLLSNEVNQAIIRLKEMNIIKKIHEKWMLGECHTKIFREVFMDGQAYFDKMTAAHDDIFSGLSVTLFAGPLIILLIGMIIAGSLLVAEVFLSGGGIKRHNIREGGHQLRESFNE